MSRIMNDWGKTEAILINIGILLIFEKKTNKATKTENYHICLSGSLIRLLALPIA